MYFVTFPVAGTNIFPHSNSKYGGQYATEYNLRAREMVGTHPSIQYEVGPSYTHSASDFEVRIQQDDVGYIVSQSTLEIMPGRAVINGHYIQTLNPMIVDLLEANSKLKKASKSPLKGELEIGIRVFYSTEPTMAGTMLIDNEEEMYLGVQLVVMPRGELITPLDSPEDRNNVNCHLKLGEFTFLNGTITSVVNYDDEKCQYVEASRVSNINQLLSGQFIKKSRLNPKRLYTFSGKGQNPETGEDTWCDSTDSLMVWDTNPQRTTTKPTLREAAFGTDSDGSTILAVPHKQVDGMTNDQGATEYYESKVYKLPVANYEKNTSGTVDKEYTRHIKDLSDRFNIIHQIVKGKQVGYLDIKDDDNTLPPINQCWNVGDYILVNQDYTADVDNDGVRAPSTMYVVLPGIVSAIKYKTKVENSEEIPSGITGAQLGKCEIQDSVPSDTSSHPFDLENDEIRGVKGEDYFVVKYVEDDKYACLYYLVETVGKKEYSTSVMLTGEIPLAQESVIGGFLNVSDDALDGGYVYRDENGHLRLLDYTLLRSGTLAYQLGEDIKVETGLTTEEVQNYLDEYVNERVAFPNAAQIANSDNPNVINIDIYLCKEEEAQTLNIYNIDSRFNTAVCINILGDSDANTTINITNCPKLRINSYISGSPIINVYKSSIYYDSSVFDYIRTCSRPTSFTGFQDIKLWYEMYEDTDPNLVVDNMTVSELDAPIIAEDLDFWNENAKNDSHYRYALNSITFAGNGDIVKCGLLVGNETTANVEQGQRIFVGEFELPQGSGLVYPKSCMTRQLKVSGTFVSAYKSDMWVVTDTNFTALTSVYDQFDMTTTVKGSIAFHANTSLIAADVGDVIAGWEPDTYHLFTGGALS